MMFATPFICGTRSMYAHVPSCCSAAQPRRPCCFVASPSRRPSIHNHCLRTRTAATAGDGLQAAQDTANDIAEESLVEEWRNLLATVDDDAPPPPDFLLRAAIMIARHRHPDLDEQAIHAELDRLAVAVRDTLGPGPHYPLHVCRVLSKVLYEDFGYSGATQSYYDPDNSCINMVLERRIGIPISLSLVYMEVARRVGLEMLGVNLPGIFCCCVVCMVVGFVSIIRNAQRVYLLLFVVCSVGSEWLTLQLLLVCDQSSFFQSASFFISPTAHTKCTGHFMLKPKAEDVEILVDAFNGAAGCTTPVILLQRYCRGRRW